MLFETKTTLKPIGAINIAYNVMFLSGAVLGFGSALLFAGSLDKVTKAWLTTTGMAGLSLYTINCKISEKPRKIAKALNAVEMDSLKYQLKEAEQVQQIEAEIKGASRKVELILKESNPWAWAWWARRAGVEANMPPLDQLTGETVEQHTSVNIPSPDITSIDRSQVDAVVSPDRLAQLEQVAKAYPHYIRIDANWLDELCDAASNPDMSKRFNHHFIVTGETQSGKSTIAGVIINMVSSKSIKPSTVIGSDPKDGVSRWLCKFSYLFNGIEAIDNWIQFAFQKANDQKKAYAVNPKEVGELFFVQDEVDSVFNGGKGFLGFLGADKKVQASQAQALQSLWNFLIKYMAGAKGHYIGIGQSPLSSDTGLSRPAYKSCCFIVLGNTANYIFDHPTDFLSVNKEIQEVLVQSFELMTNAGQRCALVIPMRGNPFVALIPQFDIDSYQGQTKIAQLEVSEAALKTVDQLMEEMIQWMQLVDELPSPHDVKVQWERISGQELKPNQLDVILKYLGLTK